ncbi:class I SAM-dependent methyltransferase [Pontibacillus salipaludis]|uniref:Methyltransferase n=1 Tax=Pontibacillus salipaludis TaxID=1697394 RepID=A0ABQ1Q6C6_9BACI|nr:class I SAM-dependent methyltransferase [Pontibacillus salipaludis]GGD15565.1 methyltransferase [Pontibacillus salipaludis]
MNLSEHNRKAWNKKVEAESRYTKAVDSEIIEQSRLGNWEICVTTEKPVPRQWFPESLEGNKVLCLASGGGQQGPILAAAGADVTVLDISDKQLEQDKLVAESEGLKIKAVQGDMSDLSAFMDQTFDIIVHPVSNLFVDDIRPVWKEAYRVLRDGGSLISGFTNPLLWLFDELKEEQGVLDVKYAVPSSTLDHLDPEEVKAYVESGDTIEYAHSLEDQIQGQIDAGFVIAGFYEDDFGGERLIDQYIRTFIATRAIR